MLVRQVKAHLPTKWGDFDLYAYADSHEVAQPHLAMVHKNMNPKETVPVRIHSECLTGDLLGSLRCDCGEQLEASLKYISNHAGVMIYLRQEGRGIGLINKLDAYNLQDEGLNTIEANIHLGFEPDERDFEIAISILKDLEIKEIDLLTNNPDKMASIAQSDIKLHVRVPLIIPAKDENEAYLKVKSQDMGHLFSY